jgi:tRNA pseudouridine synthase 10
MTAPIQSKVLDTAVSILEQYTICDRCLGRQFAWLSTGTSNSERGHSLKLTLSMIADDELKSENPNHGKKIISLLAGHGLFKPAQTIAENNSIEYGKSVECHLCSTNGQTIFDKIGDVAKKAAELSKDVEFDNFLVGTIPIPLLDDRQDELRAKYSLLHAEALKSDFSRELGKHLYELLEKEVEFERPHLVFLYDMINDTGIHLW